MDLKVENEINCQGVKLNVKIAPELLSKLQNTLQIESNLKTKNRFLAKNKNKFQIKRTKYIKFKKVKIHAKKRQK